MAMDGPAPGSPTSSGAEALDRASNGRLAGRTILVVAHDFPPVRSPQSIRATYLCRALLDAGARVVVLTRSGLGSTALPPALSEYEDALSIHRCSPGLFERSIALVAHRRAASEASPGSANADLDVSGGPARLNWKGRLVALARRTLDHAHFPDGRSAWAPAARAWLRTHAGATNLDAALLMHEPAASLLLWRDVDALGIPWAVDLADPVLAPYTRPHWRRRAARLEKDVLTHCRAAFVTNHGTAALLAERHALQPDDFHVLPQGFIESPPSPGSPKSELVLLYTGRFYAFRPHAPLVEAVLRTEGVQLHVAGPELPDSLVEASLEHPAKIHIIGEVSHEQAGKLQGLADVLVSIGNRGTAQTPGKVVEYFGARRPILHLCNDEADPIPELLAALNRGVACPATTIETMERLSRLRALKQAGLLDSGFDLRIEPVADYSWRAIGQRLADALAGIMTPS